jgi:hypothetical protein
MTGSSKAALTSPSCSAFVLRFSAVVRHDWPTIVAPQKPQKSVAMPALGPRSPAYQCPETLFPPMLTNVRRK